MAYRWTGWTRAIAVFPVVIAIWLSAYTFAAVGRSDSPYSFLLHECRDNGHCSLAQLRSQFRERLYAKDILEQTGNPLSDRWIGLIQPANLINDATAAITRHASDQNRVTALLGQSIASEMSLLHTGKWHHWPISFAYTDQLARSLSAHILQTDPVLLAGSIIIVRRDYELSGLEGDIWRKLTTEYELCAVADASSTIFAFKVADAARCHQSELNTFAK